MSRKVYTYRAIDDLYAHPCFDDIVALPHITATYDLFCAVQSFYPEIQRIITLNSLQQEMIKGWDDHETAFQQFLNISRIIRSLKVSANEQTIYGSFIKNKNEVLTAIRSLVEADISPEDFTPVCTEERLLKRVWEQMELEDEAISDLRVSIGAYLEVGQSFFHSELESITRCLESDTLVLHGFYYITPLQDRIFDILESWGKQLIFLCCIDGECTGVKEIWGKVLSADNGFDPSSKWVQDAPKNMKNQSFSKLFDGITIPQKLDHVSIIKYDSELEFIRDVDRLLDDEFNIYSTDPKATNDYLKEFYPEIYKRRHLLSYPVGQYIYRLHSMWSTKNQRLELTIDDIQACFASGWVEVDNINGLDYMNELDQLKTYVSDCKSDVDWENRIDLLLKTKENVIAPFEAYLDEVPAENRRWHKMMANPFSNLSCFDFEESKLKPLSKLIKHLIFTAKSLFTGRGEITIANHLKRIRLLISQKNDQLLFEEEKAVIDELYARLRMPNLKITKCLPGEISEAIMLIIGGGILDEENFSIQSGSDERIIRNIYQIEAAPLTESKKIHLCLADENRLPGRVKPYAWPITREMLDRLNTSADKRKAQYLRDMRFVVEQSSLANRYLFCSLLQNNEVEISWIADDNGKVIEPSPYAQILIDLFQVPVIQPQKQIVSTEEIAAIPPAETPLVLSVNYSEDSAVEAKMDVSLCAWRYIYGYLLSDQPRFTSDFHYSNVLSTLIASFVQVSGISKSVISNAVLELFPYLRDVEKQQIIDYVPYIGDEDTDPLDNASYPKSRLRIHYLQKYIADTAESSCIVQLQNSELYDAPLFEERQHKICMYCPYSPSCPHAEHNASKES